MPHRIAATNKHEKHKEPNASFTDPVEGLKRVTAESDLADSRVQSATLSRPREPHAPTGLNPSPPKHLENLLPATRMLGGELLQGDFVAGRFAALLVDARTESGPARQAPLAREAASVHPGLGSQVARRHAIKAGFVISNPPPTQTVEHPHPFHEREAVVRRWRNNSVPPDISTAMRNVSARSSSKSDVAVDPRFAGPRPPYAAKISAKQPGHEDQLLTPADHGEESYVGSGRLRGRVALITGGDSGIGRSIAIAFAREGADVAISHLPEETKDVEATALLVRGAAQRVACFPCDISQEQPCITLVEKVIEEFGKLDILVNNAAYQMTHEELDDWSSEEWDHTFRVNVYGMFYLSKAALEHLPPGGVIINTASIQSLQPKSHLLAYATSKGAVLNFTKALAELAMEKGVRVNAVAPGPVWTPLIPSTMPEEKVRNFGENTLFGRAAQPAEIAPAYVFLASNEARYMTGELVPITGGRTPL